MSIQPSTKSILPLSLITTLGILAGFIGFIVWFKFINVTFLISAALFFVGVGCVYILYKGFRQKQIIFSFAKVIVVILVVSSIFMYININDLKTRVTALEKPQLNEIDWKYVWNYFWDNGHQYMNDTVVGTVFNSGVYSINATVVFQAWGENNTVIYTKDLPLGQIGGKSYVSFETELVYDARYQGSGGSITHSFLLN